ncbi:hypothetical protein [Campylobacter troglodytis]|uniref:hypothetical protein n=1 Tax=Campylobacter troglodytis TaxID=654363 RepID=UPI00115B5C10|nr:hypothetical protein [Campylobacter troglodytis]
MNLNQQSTSEVSSNLKEIFRYGQNDKYRAFLFRLCLAIYWVAMFKMTSYSYNDKPNSKISLA